MRYIRLGFTIHLHRVKAPALFKEMDGPEGFVLGWIDIIHHGCHRTKNPRYDSQPIRTSQSDTQLKPDWLEDTKLCKNSCSSYHPFIIRMSVSDNELVRTVGSDLVTCKCFMVV